MISTFGQSHYGTVSALGAYHFCVGVPDDQTTAEGDYEIAERRRAEEKFQDCFRISPRHPDSGSHCFKTPLPMVKKKITVEGFEGRKKRRLDEDIVPVVEGK
ncbi:hypothetical protein HOY82DRAFT_609032 [Tuber indicum]|nr:hypothetical protein HOY82DRAFT_609032 [Tuber indicum]